MTSTLLCALGKLNGPGLGVLWQHLARLSLHILPHCCFAIWACKDCVVFCLNLTKFLLCRHGKEG